LELNPLVSDRSILTRLMSSVDTPLSLNLPRSHLYNDSDFLSRSPQRFPLACAPRVRPGTQNRLSEPPCLRLARHDLGFSMPEQWMSYANIEHHRSSVSSLSAEVIWDNTQHTRCVRGVICVSLGVWSNFVSARSSDACFEQPGLTGIRHMLRG